MGNSQTRRLVMKLMAVMLVVSLFAVLFIFNASQHEKYDTFVEEDSLYYSNMLADVNLGKAKIFTDSYQLLGKNGVVKTTRVALVDKYEIVTVKYDDRVDRIWVQLSDTLLHKYVGEHPEYRITYNMQNQFVLISSEFFGDKIGQIVFHERSPAANDYYNTLKWGKALANGLETIAAAM